MNPKKICHHCGRLIGLKMKYGNNRWMGRHKCPHGRWCSASDHILSSNDHSTIWGQYGCKKCIEERRENA